VPNLFWAIGQHSALGYSPFGIDSLNEDHPIGPAYKTLAGMIPVLAKYQADGKVTAVVQGDNNSEAISFGGYKLTFNFTSRRAPQQQPPAAQPGQRPPAENRSFALVVNTAPDEFLVVGQAVNVSFASDSPGPSIAAVGIIDEGRYEKGVWIPGRRINGDESNGGNRLQLTGQSIGTQKIKLYRHD
jgi:hypothetical protein